jgi:hypothetical protein
LVQQTGLIYLGNEGIEASSLEEGINLGWLGRGLSGLDAREMKFFDRDKI